MSVRQFVTLIFESESESSECEMMSRFVKENGSAFLVSLDTQIACHLIIDRA